MPMIISNTQLQLITESQKDRSIRSKVQDYIKLIEGKDPELAQKIRLEDQMIVNIRLKKYAN